jgi:serine/threonine-protein kinase HipA
VHLWGALVGAVAEDSDGNVTFEYNDAFQRSGLEISPIRLPLSTRGPLHFPELRSSDAFHGLPGVLADSLPDRFGNAVIRRYFEERGQSHRALSPVQRLLYVGDRAMGALQFQPSLDLPDRGAEQLPLDIAELVAQSRSIIEGRSDVAVPEIMLVGASAGGMRPKALILWNRARSEVRSGHAPLREGDEHWIIKFDGVPPAGADLTTGSGGAGEPQPYMRIEYAYSLVARRAGLVLPETHLLRERDFAHFMARRFDRDGNLRLHQHTLGGMLHIDYNIPGAASYEVYLRTVLRLGLSHDALEEAYRRAVFNVAAVNQDDHVKNLSFLMDGQGSWALSPAYDVTYARGHGWTRNHQMTVRGKREGITREDLLLLGREFGLGRRAAGIVDEVAAALDGWEGAAEEAGVPAHWVRRIREEIRELRGGATAASDH